MTKPPMWQGRRVTCCYCKRQLDPSVPERPTSMTWDHVKAESDGGVRKLPCCRQCNHLKDNLPVEDWFWFIGAHPGWVKEFKNPAQVRRVIREFRFSQATSGQRPYRLKGRRELPFLGDSYGRNWS